MQCTSGAKRLTSSNTQSFPTAKSAPWIFNPALDLFFACGGLFWLIFIAHFYLARSSGSTNLALELPIEAPILLAGAAILSNSHVAATFVRLYENREQRNRAWFLSYFSLALVVALIVVSLLHPIAFAILLLLYTATVIDHTIAQNYGVTVMYCYRSNYVFAPYEKLSLKLMHHALIWYAILRQYTYPGWIPDQRFGFPVPLLGPLPEYFSIAAAVLLFISTVAFGIISSSNSVKSGRAMPLPAWFLIITSLLMFCSGFELVSTYFLLMPAFFHAIQYLLITTSYELRQHKSADAAPASPDDSISLTRRLLSGPNLKYWLLIFCLGSLIFVLAPWCLTYSGIPYAKTSIAVLICVSFHHFLSDSVIWKLRDRNVRNNLISH